MRVFIIAETGNRLWSANVKFLDVRMKIGAVSLCKKKYIIQKMLMEYFAL